jgi:hypothetical protein
VHRRLLAPVSVLLGCAAGLAVVGVVDPNEPGIYPTCPSLLLTGLYCPGCGTLRMLHALLHGDPAEAVAMNPFALAVLPFLAGSWVIWVTRIVADRPRSTLLPAWPVWLLVVAVLGYWVARNVPALGWLAPG